MYKLILNIKSALEKKNLPSAEVSVQNRNKTRTTAVLWIGRWLMAMHFRSTATYIGDNNRKKNDRGEKQIQYFYTFLFYLHR